MIVVVVDSVNDSQFRRTWTLSTKLRHGHGGGGWWSMVDVDAMELHAVWEMGDTPADAKASHFS